MRALPQDRTLQEQAKALRRFNRFYTARLGLLQESHLDSNLSLSEARILYEIAQNPATTAAALRKTLALDAGYMSRMLCSFEKRRLIQRKPSKQDARELLLKLTPAGKRIATKLDSQSSREMSLLLESLPPQKRETLVHALTTAHEILSAPTIVKATTIEAADAKLLLNEYYDAINVIQRDTQKSIQSFLSDPAAGLWIAYVDGTPAGCVVLKPLPNIPSASECKRLYVRSEFRRRGIAEALLDAMEAHARKLSLTWVYLDSKDDLPVAIALYKRRGYEPCARYNDNPQATIFLRKRLTRK